MIDRRDAALMGAIVAALCAVTLVWGERIGINAGMGWDGESYVRWAMHFPAALLDTGTTAYHAQRVVPSAIIWAVCSLLGVSRTVAHVVAAFRVFDAVFLVGAAGLWAHLAARMQWRRATAWVGFVALFGGFANARHALYYPALTDTFAFALGLVLSWAYLLRRPFVVWLTGLFGALTWPALLPLACVMLLLPRVPATMGADPVARRHWVVIASAVLAAAATAAIVGFGFHYLAHPVPALGIPKFATWVRRDWLPVTVPLLVAALFAGWFVVLHQPALWNLRAYGKTLHARRVALAAAGIVVIGVVRALWLRRVVTQGSGPTGAQFLCQQTLEALRGPLWGLVHHVVFYGPVIVVAGLRWRAVCAAAARWGHGGALALVFVIAFLGPSESRQWIHLLPFLVAATMAATDHVWTRGRVVAFVALSLAWSKLWLHIGYDTAGDWRVFPTQRYFMNLGPWASDTMYLVHLGAAALTTVLLWLVVRQPREPSASGTQIHSSPSPRSP